MRAFALVTAVALLGACAPAEREPAMMEEEAAALTVADFAGTWTMQATLDTPDTAVVDYTVSGGADPASWMITLPNRDPMPARVTVAGDSAVFEVGPYESILRAGVMVTTRSVGRLSGGRMTGTLVARYETAEADSVVRGVFEGSRAP